MSKPALHNLAVELKIAVLFSTRLPLAHGSPFAGADLARAMWALPIAGALVGGLGALVYWVAFRLGLAPLICATLTMAATMLATGCLHEDGLADTADGFGVRAERERKLAIMRDSRTGTYGACALALSTLLRASALAVLAEPALVAPALIAAHAGGRAILPLFLYLVPPARKDGLSASAGRPPLARAITAAAIGGAIMAAALGLRAGATAALLLAAAFAGMAQLARRQIGGQTGDVAGALEQAGEALVLMAATVA
jgi:adenosylcobinamide-GDP ribazoletransferase